MSALGRRAAALFRLEEPGTTGQTEVLAGLTTCLTMAYIIFVQPAVLLRWLIPVLPESLASSSVVRESHLVTRFAPAASLVACRLPSGRPSSRRTSRPRSPPR